MRVVCFCGYSGMGKTALLEQVIALLRQRGQRVSVLKHAHQHFDIDHPGKDSHRHRQAGAYEVLIASGRRLALMREFEQPTELGVHELIAQLDPGVDWVLAEGFKSSDLPKIEVWRADVGKPALYPHDPHIIAVATDAPDRLPQPPQRPVLQLNQPQAVVDWLLAQGARFAYP